MSTREHGHCADCHCHYLPGLMTVPSDRMDEAIRIVGGRALDNGELCRVLDGLDHEIVSRIRELVGVFEIGEDDPHQIAGALAKQGMRAAPVHGVGFMGHSGYQGSQWTDANIVLTPVTDAEGGIVAVVDSGVAPDLPYWIDDPNVIFERPVDTEQLPHKDPVSHGTFVTSVIRRITPQHAVSIASARPDPGHLVTTEPYHDEAHRMLRPPTDELNVLGAVLRLIRRHANGHGEVLALNLSLGAHECEHTNGGFYLSLEAARDIWMQHFPDAPIVAAGGNSTCPRPVIPAALDGVRAVAAAREGRSRSKSGDSGGVIKVWHHGTEVTAPDRDWITDVGPGCDVIGLSGQSDDHTVKWSGSSFATAVVTACLADGGYTPTPDDGKEWWPDRNVTYGSVSGLVP